MNVSIHRHRGLCKAMIQNLALFFRKRNLGFAKEGVGAKPCRSLANAANARYVKRNKAKE